ncbi:hypothetical protein CHU92_00555 [Flavobacterium cyanobacteriorum]|uniref:Uncharacterized protein n=1 Tax=Flavobacterium cyanobacteriorum TaxID=2022802 RepID=A0A256A4X1_9FLAO|nr:hypothetical protein [Flavobacterium cyanobacteriorum]OYQ48681.1 hypothetical protein CHU92_00555 [Flavobacterium cyanobacteriorum]
MKKMKFYALGIVSAALLTAGLYACSSETTDSPQEESSVNFQTKSRVGFTKEQIGEIRNGVAVPLYDEARVKADLITSGVFAQVESIELAYGINPTTNSGEAIVTIIGKEKATSPALAIVADLVIDGNRLFILNPETNQQAFAKHVCAGQNCGWCEFDRTWFLGRIRGCKPCSRVVDESKPSGCIHSQSSGGGMTIIKEASNILIKNAI